MEKNLERYRLRKYIGILGLFLPLLLYLSYDSSILLNSFSHYYYTRASVFFIAIIFSFAILLLSYNGYEKLPSEKVSDNFITSLAGIFALITVIVPTGSEGSGGEIPFNASPYLFGYDSNTILNTIHLLSAGTFLCLLGYMSYFKFTLSIKNSKRLNNFYKACAIIIWGSIACLLIFMLIEKTGYKFSFPYIFIFEFIAIEAFAISWLRKAKTFLFLKN